MDYLKIVLDGYFNPNTRPHLEDHFYRQILEAQTKNYSPDEFYTGCYNLFRAFEKDLAEKLQKRKSEINEQRVAISNAMVTETDETEREELKEMKDSLFKESKQLTIGDFEVNLLAQKWGGHNVRLNTSDILIIEEALKSAYLKICPPPKSEDEVFEDLIKETNDAMKGKSFDEKVEWFEKNAMRVQRPYESKETDGDKYIEDELKEEIFFAHSFAHYKQKKPRVTKEEFIELQIEHLADVIRRFDQDRAANGETVERIFHKRRLLKYFQSLPQLMGTEIVASGNLFIEDLTTDKIEKLGFSSDSIKKLNSKEPYECFHIPAVGNYIFASNISRKIYSDIEGAKKQYFRNENQIAFPIDWPSLMPEYYQIKWTHRSKIEKELKQSTYDPVKTEMTFLKEQIDLVEKEINKYSDPGDIYSKHILEGLQEYLKWLQIKAESDLEFISGLITLTFVPQGASGHFKIIKSGQQRKYTLEHYFDYELKNWEDAIDKATGKTEKLQIANNGIFLTQKKWLNQSHSKIQELKEKNINHLKAIVEYIKVNYDDNVMHSNIKTAKDNENGITAKQNTDVRLILFNSPETIDRVELLLKGYFVGNETFLKDALQGKKLSEPLIFPSSQNKLVEFVKRLSYNGYVMSTAIEIRDWLCLNFTFTYRKGEINEIKQFNQSTVYDILTKGRGEPPKGKRICYENVDWLPYKSKTQLDTEREKEKLQ